jgi:hypothetical protein
MEWFMKKKVLIILGPHDQDICGALTFALQRRNPDVEVAVIHANSLVSGHARFTQHKAELDAVIVGDCIDNSHFLDSLDYIYTMHGTGFDKIVGLSDEVENLKRMTDNGATYAFHHSQVVDELYKILGI